MASWNTAIDSKLVWAPIGMRTLKDGTTKPRFVKIGVKVEMADGSWWFFSFRHESWTQHFVPVRAMDRLGRPAMQGNSPLYLPARVVRWATTEKVVKEFGSRAPGLVLALQTGLEAALEAQEAE